jgi:membrane protein DedA with SNARE-associated domain
MTSLISGLAGWVTTIVTAMGYWGIALLVALENLLPPIPSELVLPLAGFLAGRGRFSLPMVVLAATGGSVAGALVLYALGRRLGEERLRRFVKGPGRYLLLREHDLDRAASWFDRHGGQAVFIGRLVPFVRSGVSVPAGVERMSVWRFTLYTTAGSAVWNGILVGLGWALGEQWERVSEYTQWLSYAVLAAVTAAIGWFVWRRTGRP